MKEKQRILVASLNWGLGHSTRCIPIINALINQDFEPIIASDGAALLFLKKEFPKLLALELPCYHIRYPKKSTYFKFHFLKSIPKIYTTIQQERQQTDKIIRDLNITGIISDNRLGVVSNKVPTVFMTHQITVLSGLTSWLSTKVHQYYIEKYDECWIPDHQEHGNLSGKLGRNTSIKIPVKYLGPLSRFKKRKTTMKYDFLILISGPEPQRSFFEELLLKTFKYYSGNIIMVRGVIEQEVSQINYGNMTIYNFLSSNELEKVINQSHNVISRSGYSTIMDLAKLSKKAFFIPTPGQYEQIYLAKSLQEKGIAYSCKQENFNIEAIKNMKGFSGFLSTDFTTNYKKLFHLFHSE